MRCRTIHERPEAHPQARSAEPLSTERQSVGVRRLDRLLGGGLRSRSSFLLVGPAFTGKRILQGLALRDAANNGRPAVVVTTRRPADQVRRGINGLKGSEDNGRVAVRFVDAYSRRIGIQSSEPHTRMVEPVRLEALIHAINASLAEVHPDPREDRLLIVDSITGLVAHNGVGQVYSFLEMLIGCAKAHRAVIHLSIDGLAHRPRDLALLRFLADNVLELRSDTRGRVLHLSGVDVIEELPWIEYTYGRDDFEITGSFTATRIR